MVSTLHTGEESVTKDRKKPRPTQTNLPHLRRVWGENYVVTIDTPSMIDDYNHSMLGVDKADQLISNYRPILQCRRTWFPLVLHCLDIIRINSFIIMKWYMKGKLEQKRYVEAFINALLSRATAYRCEAPTRRAAELFCTPPSSMESSNQKRRRISLSTPTLPLYRLEGHRSEHQMVMAAGQGQKACIYCSFLYQMAKNQGRLPLPKVRRITRVCLRCKDHLCMEHFNLFHEWE